MSTWSEAPARSRVLRGGATAGVRTARIDSDLRTTPFAPAHAVDARLTDPHLEAVVAEATHVATEQGRAAGYEQGYAAGAARAAAEAAVRAAEQELVVAEAERSRDVRLAAQLDVLRTATEAFLRREAVAVADVESAVVDLALGLARAVLDRELSTAVDPGREAVERALALAPQGTPAVARLHPDDLALLADADHLAEGRGLTLVPDPAVERGGCVVDTAGRRIDAQVGPALERAAAVLR